MADFLYDHPQDKVTGTWSQVGGTVNPLYPLTNIDDGKPSNPVIFTANPSRIVIDLGTPKPCALVSFIHCNFPAGYGIHVQRGSAIGTAAQDVAVTCPGPTSSGHPSNPWSDLTGDATSYRYIWFELPATGTLLSLGFIRLSGVKRQSTDMNLLWNLVPDKFFPLIEKPTDADVQIGYGRGTRARTVVGQVKPTEPAYAALDDLFEASLGRTLPWAFILDPAVNESMWVRFGTDTTFRLARTRIGPLISSVPVSLEEVGRGLRP